MAFRVTNIQTTAKFIDQIFRQREALEQTRQQVSTGYKIAAASDDPGRAATISQFQSSLQRIDRHKQRIVSATGFLEAQEGILQASESTMLRAKELAAQGANETLGVDERTLLAEEVWQLRDEMVALANSQYQGVYLYGGNDDDDAPFDAAAAPGYADPGGTDPESVRYAYDDITAEPGNADTRSVTIADGVTVRLNTTGDGVFARAIGALEVLGRALTDGGYDSTLDANNVPTGAGAAYTTFDEQTAGIQTAIDLLESARAQDIGAERASVGARLNRLTQANEVLDIVKLNTQTAKSSIQDVDIFEAASNLSSLQVALEGLLSSGAQINSLSLLNYL